MISPFFIIRYSNLSDCYNDKYNTIEESSTSAPISSYLFALRECYGDYAYVYLSDTSVYNVTLANFTTDKYSYSSPLVSTYRYDIPTGR